MESIVVERENVTYKGHVAGKTGTNEPSSPHVSFGWIPATPPSPEANTMLVPRVPSCAKEKHSALYDTTPTSVIVVGHGGGWEKQIEGLTMS